MSYGLGEIKYILFDGHVTGCCFNGTTPIRLPKCPLSPRDEMTQRDEMAQGETAGEHQFLYGFPNDKGVPSSRNCVSHERGGRTAQGPASDVAAAEHGSSRGVRRAPARRARRAAWCAAAARHGGGALEWRLLSSQRASPPSRGNPSTAEGAMLAQARRPPRTEERTMARNVHARERGRPNWVVDSGVGHVEFWTWSCS